MSEEKIEVHIEVGDAALEGILHLPEEATSIVVFAHGSGSSRFSPRNHYVASKIQERGAAATLLMDLLTPEEEEEDRTTRRFRFDIALLADRVAAATEWLMEYEITENLEVGYIGSSTGAAAALIAAAKLEEQIGAVVSRGGRPDLAGEFLPLVTAPTLLIVGGNDREVIDLNQIAIEKMTCERELKLVEGATHLFEEEGALEQAAELASAWFFEHLT